jgi:hypothetical protein
MKPSDDGVYFVVRRSDGYALYGQHRPRSAADAVFVPPKSTERCPILWFGRVAAGNVAARLQALGLDVDVTPIDPYLPSA